jgi:hypothetical protein
MARALRACTFQDHDVAHGSHAAGMTVVLILSGAKKYLHVKRMSLTLFGTLIFYFHNRTQRSAQCCSSSRLLLVLAIFISFDPRAKISPYNANHNAENADVIFREAVNVFREVVLWICFK